MKTENLLLLGILAIGILIGLFIMDCAFSVPERHHGVVIDKQYESEHNSTGVGYGGGQNGGPVITHNHEDEKFLLIVRSGGDIVTVKLQKDV